MIIGRIYIIKKPFMQFKKRKEEKR